MTQQPFFATPDKAVLKATVPDAVCFLLLFGIVYGGADAIAAARAREFDIAMSWEHRIPLLEWTAIFYLSIGPMMAIGPWVIRSVSEFRFAVALLATELLLAAPVFMLLPARDSYAHQLPSGPFADLLRLADAMNLDYNELPSLHVAFAITTAWLYASRQRRGVKLWLAAWALVVVLSTLTTHQHHVFGVAGGVLLAAGAIGVARRTAPAYGRELSFVKTRNPRFRGRRSAG